MTADAEQAPRFADLTAAELEMLGHALQMVPGNACLRGASATRLHDGGVALFYEIPAFKSLWTKVARAIAERDDLAEARTK